MKIPTIYGWLDGRSCSCMLYSENHFKTCAWMGGSNMRYTLIIIVVSIGIIGLFQLVPILTFIVYSYIFIYVCLHFKEYQFLLVSIFHTYICFVYAKAWGLTLFQLIQFSIGILFQAYACVLLVFHKGGENSIFMFTIGICISTPLLYDRK